MRTVAKIHTLGNETSGNTILPMKVREECMLATCEKQPLSATSKMVHCKHLTIVLALLYVPPIGTWPKKRIRLRTRPHLWASWSMWAAIESISIAPVRGALLSLSLARVFLSIGDLSNPKSRDLLRCVRMTTQESVGANPVRKTHAPSGLARYTPH